MNNNIVELSSLSEQDEKEFESIKEFEYTPHDIKNIYLRWGKNRGLRAEVEPIGFDKLIFKVNESSDRAWIYIKERNGTEHKYILEPIEFPEFGIVYDDILLRFRDSDNIYSLYFLYIFYILFFHTEKIIRHNKNYINKTKKKIIELCKYNYFKERRDIVKNLIEDPIIEKFD